MNHRRHIVTRLVELSETLHERLFALTETLCDAHRAEVFRLPVHAGSDIPNVLTVAHLTGSAAVAESLSGFTLTRRVEGQHPCTVFRLPGLLWSTEDVSDAVTTINRLKDQVRETINNSGIEGKERSKLAREALPDCSLLQLYRHLHVLPANVHHVGFTWEPVSTGSRRMTVKALRELLINRLATPIEDDSDERRAAIEIDLRLIRQLSPDATIVQRKPAAPNPRMNWTATDNGRTERSMKPANLPVIVPPGHRSLSVTPLSTYDAAERRQQRSDKQHLLPVCEQLGVYVQTGST